jgi:hypothetical protein
VSNDVANETGSYGVVPKCKARCARRHLHVAPSSQASGPEEYLVKRNAAYLLRVRRAIDIDARLADSMHLRAELPHRTIALDLGPFECSSAR